MTYINFINDTMYEEEIIYLPMFASSSRSRNECWISDDRRIGIARLRVALADNGAAVPRLVVLEKERR